MRRTFQIAFAGAIALMLVLTACGRSSLGEGGGGSAPGSTGGGASGSPGDDCEDIPPIPDASTDPESPVSSDCSTTPGGPPDDPKPRVVIPRTGMDNVHPIGWDTYAVVSTDGRTLRLTFYSGVEPCYVLDHIEVLDGESEVTITLFEGSDPDAENVACIDIAELKAVDVTLPGALGDRDVLDGTD